VILPVAVVEDRTHVQYAVVKPCDISLRSVVKHTHTDTCLTVLCPGLPG